MPPPEARAQSARFSFRTAALLFAAVILLWGVNWPVMKIGLESIPPFHFALARMLLGGLTMFAVAAMVGQLRLPSRHDLPVVLSVGLLQMGAFMALVTWGLEFVGGGTRPCHPSSLAPDEVPTTPGRHQPTRRD